LNNVNPIILGKIVKEIINLYIIYILADVVRFPVLFSPQPFKPPISVIGSGSPVASVARLMPTRLVPVLNFQKVREGLPPSTDSSLSNTPPSNSPLPSVTALPRTKLHQSMAIIFALRLALSSWAQIHGLRLHP